MFSLVWSKNLKKYQEESTKVSIVSDSLFAGPLHCGHVQFLKIYDWRGFNELFSLLSEEPFHSGSSTGKSDSGTGTVPHLSQYMIGIGVPQYLCREIDQSFKRVTSLSFSFKFCPFCFNSLSFVSFGYTLVYSVTNWYFVPFCYCPKTILIFSPFKGFFA